MRCEASEPMKRQTEGIVRHSDSGKVLLFPAIYIC